MNVIFTFTFIISPEKQNHEDSNVERNYKINS